MRGRIYDCYIPAMVKAPWSISSNNHDKIEYSESLDLQESQGSQSAFPGPVV